MCTALVIHDVGTDAAFVGVLVVAEGIFIAPVTGAENHKLGVAVHDLGENGIDQIKTLLVCQTGNQTDDELAVILLETEFFLQSALILLLFLQRISKRVICGEQFVRRGIPDVHINAVDNTAELGGMVAQMGIKTFPVIRGLNLPGVGVGHGGDHIRIGKTALEHVHGVLILQEDVVVEKTVRQAGPVFQPRDIAHSLEAEIMDGEHGLCAGDFCAGKLRAEIHRDKRRLPVVAVDDVGDPVHIIQGGQSCLGKIAVFGNIIVQVGVGVAPAEEFIIVDEVINHAVPYIFHNADVIGVSVRAEVHHEVTAVDHLFLILPGDASVAGQDYLHITVLPGECSGESIHHIAQTAGFHKRIAL